MMENVTHVHAASLTAELAYPERRNWYYWWALIFVSLALCLPLLSVSHVPLVDYPNHLARVEILYEYRDVPAYQLNYYRILAPIPNLAVDALVMAMLPFMGMVTAGKIFLLLNLLLFITGCHKLGSAIHGRATLLVLPCLFFFYNSMLFYGFVNYMFGVGAFCFTLAYRLNRRQRWTKGSTLVLTVFTCIAFFAHLSSFLFLGVTLVVVAAWDYLTGAESFRAAVLSLVPLLGPSFAFVIFLAGNGTTGEIHWNTISGKLIGTLSLVLSYHYWLDTIVLAGFAAIMLMVATRLQSLKVDWPIFISAAIFFVLYLFSPKVLFTSSSADARFILPAALLFTLSLKLSLPARIRNQVIVLFLSLASIRLIFIWQTWQNLDRQIVAEVEQLNKLPEGATVYPIFVLPDDRQEAKVERSLVHIVHYATIHRHALVPTLFAQKEQQPLAFRTAPHFTSPAQQQTEDWVQLSDKWLPYITEYDYVWGHRVQGKLEQLLYSRCEKVDESGTFSLWRVKEPLKRKSTLTQ